MKQMMHAAVTDVDLRTLVDAWLQNYRVVAPVYDDGVLVYAPVSSGSELELTDVLPYKSPKEFLFPQVEKVMEFSDQGQVLEAETVPTILLGVRPCDLEALRVLHSVFTGGPFLDPFFAAHWENTVLVGLGCLEKKKGCFCDERQVSSGASNDCDLFFHRRGDQLYAEALTEKGRSLLSEDEWRSEELPPQDRAVLDSGEGQLEITADERTVFEEVDWRRITERCLGCGICTYICPTCHCFDFRDVQEDDVSSRYRCWDSCMYPKFTEHASGHNPRNTKRERYRQRVMHKFVYVPKNFGSVACTGCGRCIRSCPVGMNIRSIVSDVMEDLS